MARPRVQLELADEHDLHVGRKRVAGLMRELGVEGVSRRGKKRRTTLPDPKAPPAPDLVERKFVAAAPKRLWLADLTYVPTLAGYLFLGIVMGMYSRKTLGWKTPAEFLDEHLRSLEQATVATTP